jgi:hypothetical protein
MRFKKCPHRISGEKYENDTHNNLGIAANIAGMVIHFPGRIFCFIPSSGKNIQLSPPNV